MSAAGLDAMLVTSGVDVAYLSGFTGSNGALLVTADTEVLATDGRYRDQAAAQCPGVTLVITRTLLKGLLAADSGLTRFGFDPTSLTVEQWEGLRDADVDLKPVSLSDVRKVKDDAELADIRHACQITVAALADLLPEIEVGISELEVARRLELLMGRRGAEDRAFPTIVASGPNSAIPHHRPTERVLAAGDLLKIDFGARFNGYHADCTRTFVVAANPEPWQQEIHDIVARAQAAGIAALKPGATGSEIDVAARSVIASAGYGEAFDHGLGHGVGLEIHEAPFLGPGSANTVEARVPLTVEPGIYLPGRGGVRIEDTLIVGDDGSEVLTQFSRDLIRVG